jgi:hypothetical protein
MIRLPFYIDPTGKIAEGDWSRRLTWRIQQRIMAAEDEAIFKILDALVAESSSDSSNKDI